MTQKHKSGSGDDVDNATNTQARDGQTKGTSKALSQYVFGWFKF